MLESGSFYFAGTDETGNDCKTDYLVGFIILAMFLVIFLFIFHCFWCNRRKLPNTKHEDIRVKETNDAKHIYGNPDEDDINNYEDVKNEESIYTDLNRPVAVNIEHVYCHLNTIHQADIDDN